jgi:ribosomal protein S18 acetylase RimI-like enzyme
VTRFRQEVASGTSRPALVLDEGRPIAGACLIGVGAEAELAGVWTSPAHRRRGFATAACAALLRDFFNRGGELIWLSTAEHGSEALYRKLGFRRVGTQCNYVWPAGIPLPLQSSAA